MKTKAIFLLFAITLYFIPAHGFSENRFGVMIGGKGRLPGTIELVQELGGKWVRINESLEGSSADFRSYLDAGQNLVINISNHDTSNMVTEFGNAEEFDHAGFPFRSKSRYEDRIREVLKPLRGYLDNGRIIIAQCENEIGDASINPKSRYWRGTLENYIDQVNAFYEIVKRIDPRFLVALDGFASEPLDKVGGIEGKSERTRYAERLLKTQLMQAKYDVVDLHFYGCQEDIGRKVKWAKSLMRQGAKWISTENGGPDHRCENGGMSWKEDQSRYEDRQREEVVKRLGACAENGGFVCLWFSLFDLRKEVETFSHMGLADISEVIENIKEMKGKKSFGGRRGGNSHEKIGQKLDLAKIDKNKILDNIRRKPAFFAFKEFVKRRSV